MGPAADAANSGVCIWAQALRRLPVHKEVGAAVPRDEMMLLVQEPRLLVVTVEFVPDTAQAHPLLVGAFVARLSGELIPLDENVGEVPLR